MPPLRQSVRYMAEEEEPAPVEPGPTLLTTELIAANLSILEEVQGSAADTGFAYTKCDLGASQCEVEAAADAFQYFKQLRYLSLAACKLTSCQPVALLPELMSLDLSKVTLAEPGSLPPLPSLQLLQLGSCGVASFAGCAWDYPALRSLDLSGNSLTELPDFGLHPAPLQLHICAPAPPHPLRPVLSAPSVPWPFAALSSPVHACIS